MSFSSEKVVLLSGSMSQQLSVITLYLWQTGRRHKRAWRDARSGNMHYTTHSSGLQPSGFMSLLPLEMAFAASELLKWW